MSGNTIGKIFRVTTYGESHGVASGGIIDGCPAGLVIDLDSIRHDLDRRRATLSVFSTSRLEEDEPEFLSGIYQGITTGAPIAFLIQNKQQDSKAYDDLKGRFRPGHGDFSWHMKYGHYDQRGGGRYSARETVARVVAGAIARQFISFANIKIQAWVAGIGQTLLNGYGPFSDTSIESSEVRCPDAAASAAMMQEISNVAERGDTLGGIIAASITGVPPGIGEPVFDKIEAELAKAMLSIPSAKAFEMGDGFEGSLLRGSEQNDLLSLDTASRITSATNHAGGTLGGLSSGSPIHFRVGFKPVSSIRRPQPSISHEGEPVTIDQTTGRHDVCVVPRAVPIVEAMAAIVIADLLLRNRSARR